MFYVIYGMCKKEHEKDIIYILSLNQLGLEREKEEEGGERKKKKERKEKGVKKKMYHVFKTNNNLLNF